MCFVHQNTSLSCTFKFGLRTGKRRDDVVFIPSALAEYRRKTGISASSWPRQLRVFRAIRVSERPGFSRTRKGPRVKRGEGSGALSLATLSRAIHGAAPGGRITMRPILFLTKLSLRGQRQIRQDRIWAASLPRRGEGQGWPESK